jgi:hypothetical protein
MTKNQLSKICINCSLQKPINAFLQIAGPQGTTYGNICSTCRGSGLGKKIVLPVNEDASSSSSSTGLKIDAKSKIHADLEKKAATEKKTEEAKKERETLDLNNASVEDRKNAKQNLERKHREDFIDPSKKKSSFLDYQSKKPEDKRQASEKRALDEIMHQNDPVAKQEAQAKGFADLTVTHIDPTQAGTLKYASAEWKKFRTLLGHSAAFNKVEEQIKTPGVSKDALLDYTEENFENEKPAPTSPGTRRR